MRTTILCILVALVAVACSHAKPNFQLDCDLVGKDPKTGKTVSTCE